jgi:hypothetical protein
MYQSFDTGLRASGCDTKVLQDPIQSPPQYGIDHEEVEAENSHCDHDNDGRSNNFLTARPGNFSHFTARVGVKLFRLRYPLFNLFCQIHFLDGCAHRVCIRSRSSTLKSAGRPGGIRTPSIRFWRPALYQLELLACTLLKDHPKSIPDLKLFRLFMYRVMTASGTELLHFQTLCGLFLVFSG